jgi:type II secretory pathway predicted ATPase ExeA
LEKSMETSGFLLVDSCFRPVYANPESVKILSYPNTCANPASLHGILTQKILSFLPREHDLSQGNAVTQFQSGRRHYSCRAFLLEDHWNGGVRETRIALLFERGLPGPPGTVKYHRKLSGTSEDAFSFSPDARFFYLGRPYQEIVVSTLSMIRERRGLGVILAQAGMGKTALLEHLSETLRPESDIVRMPGSFTTRTELVCGVMGILGLDGGGNDLCGNLEHFENWLVSRQQEGRLVTIMCDDAQDLSFDILETLCRFADMTAGEQKLLQVVLTGRQGLLEKLTGARLEAVASKICAYSRMAPLDESGVRSYVLHRLRTARCKRQLFTSAALSSIALYSRGIPLNVNMLCRHSLSLAATLNMQTVDDRIVADSAYDLVLRAQPACFGDQSQWGEFGVGQDSRRRRDRRGLKLVEKPTT